MQRILPETSTGEILQMGNVEGLCYLEHHFTKLENVALNGKIPSSYGLWWYFSFLLFGKENIIIEKYLTNNNFKKNAHG